ncbi:site-2 protease family protein [Planosporangium sp. 12N6]|uniref:site-2 protease family protein n=1 Tax=Planosporangium spinosum TaxID=3402278 RepID=UPI003CE6BD93
MGSQRRSYGLSRAQFRPSPIFVCLVGLVAVSGWMAWQGIGNDRFNVFLFVASGWLVSLCLHEYAHAVVAFHGGDRMVAERGYLTLDPTKYTHPFLSFVIPLAFVLLGGIGLPGGAVWVDRHAIRSRGWDSFISFAGPATNLLFSILLVLPFAWGVDTFAHVTFWSGVAFLAFLQLTATVLNFVPIPGVDGGNLVEPWLSPQWQRGFQHVAPYGMLLLIALLWTPAINGLFFNVVFFLGDLIGLPISLVAEGHRLFPSLAL